VKERVRRSVNPIPNSDPNPKQAPQMSLNSTYTGALTLQKFVQALRGGAATHSRPAFLALGTRDRAHLSAFFSKGRQGVVEGSNAVSGLEGFNAVSGLEGQGRSGPGNGDAREEHVAAAVGTGRGGLGRGRNVLPGALGSVKVLDDRGRARMRLRAMSPVIRSRQSMSPTKAAIQGGRVLKAPKLTARRSMSPTKGANQALKLTGGQRAWGLELEEEEPTWAGGDGGDNLFEAQKQISDEALLREIVARGGHIVLLGLSGYVYKTLIRITQELTSPHLPLSFRTVPIVVLYHRSARC